MTFDIGVQLYSHIKQVINFHIDMVQPDKTKVIPDKVLTDEVNKYLNISTNSSISNNKSVPTIQ